MSTSVNTLPDRWREKISKSNLFDRLISHLKGELEPPLNAADMNGILKVIGKVLPDLKSVEVTGSINHTTLNRGELEARLTAMGRDPTELFKNIGNVQPIQQVIEHEPIDQAEPTDTQSIADESQAVDSKG